ncbi:hypothetical protein J6590_093631, partial [Homalodisca vitripennis]
ASDCVTGNYRCRCMSQSAGLSISCVRYETSDWNESSEESGDYVWRVEGRCH